jgi:predicted DNA-binding protein
MKASNEKTTIYLNPKIKKSVQYYALRDSSSLSAIINEKLYEYLEDMADIAALEEARNNGEDMLSIEQVIKELGLDSDKVRSKAQKKRRQAVKKAR